MTAWSGEKRGGGETKRAAGPVKIYLLLLAVVYNKMSITETVSESNMGASNSLSKGSF